MSVSDLLKNNWQWSQDIAGKDPHFFKGLEKIQTPKYMWVGCADSRVPANQILGLEPGEVFVHRNVANLVVHTDLNCLSVLQYAVDILKVEHIIVCGHYNCGGINAALEHRSLGLIDNWLMHVKDVLSLHGEELSKIASVKERQSRLAELNVRQQVKNLSSTAIAQAAWKRGQKLAVHGLIYALSDGRLKDLEVSVDNALQVDEIFRLG